MTEQQVLGYDPNTGRAVLGYDPNTGKAVFAPVTQATTTEKPRSILSDIGQTVIPTPIGGVPLSVMAETARQNAPSIGAAIGAGMTGGTAVVPMVLAAGAGGAVGQAVKDAPEEMSAQDRLWNMGESGLLQAALQGASAAVPAIARGGQQMARNLWNKAAKITEPVAKNTQTMRAGGTLAQGKDEIAETVLSQGLGTLRRGNLETMADRLDAIDDAIDAVVSGSSGMVARQELRDALVTKYGTITPGTHAAEVERNALESAYALLSKAPPKMTVEYAQKMKRDIYRAYAKTFAANASEAATAMADKTTGRALRSAIAREVPEVAPMNEAMSRMIPAKSAMDKAVGGRTANNNLAGLSQMLAGMVPNKVTVISALINHPKVGSFTAQQLYNAAKRLPEGARTAANIIRLAGAMTPVASHEGRDE